MPRDYLFQWRRGTAAEWASADPVLEAGEPGFETDTGKVKVGDGVTVWTLLEYANEEQYLTPAEGDAAYAPGGTAGTASAAALAAHEADTANPHAVTKDQVGLGNVDDTADADKPVSTAQAAADALRVLKAGDTMTGNLTIDKSNAALNLDADGGTQPIIRFQQDAVDRWIIYRRTDGRLVFSRRDATGAFQDNPVEISDDDGSLTLGTVNGLTSSGNVTIDKATPNFNLDADTGTDGLLYLKENGVIRWRLARIGSTGKFSISRYSSSGVFQSTPFEINDDDGAVSLNGIAHYSDTGSPEGVQVAAVGSKYTDTAATNGAIEWVKATGTGSTGWVVTFGDTGRRAIYSDLVDATNFPVHSADVYLTRKNNTVMLSAGSLQTAASLAAGSTFISELPLGFRAAHSDFLPLMLRTNAPSNVYTLRLVPGYGTPSYAVVTGEAMNNHALSFMASWETSDPWPTTLPGTVA